MTIAVIDYGSGNIRSAAKAFARAANEVGYPGDVAVVSEAAALSSASRIVLPGQGAFAECMRGLSALPDMVDALVDAVRRRGLPFFGICVGMQLMAERGLEHGVHQGLGWIGGDIVPLEPADPDLKIPHMGWNDLLRGADGHPLLAGLPDAAHVYFVHSYAMRCSDARDVVARTDYGGALTAMVARDTMVGTQFHPEKSQAVGLKMIANFLNWRP